MDLTRKVSPLLLSANQNTPTDTTMASIEARITALEATIASYESMLATTPPDERKSLFELITAKEVRLHDLNTQLESKIFCKIPIDGLFI
jgi:hypothetical protein